MSNIKVTVCKPDLSVAGQWDALIRRAPANVFMSPIALAAAQATQFANLHVLQASQRLEGEERLVGIWAFEERRAAPLWPTFLAAPPYEYSFLSNPVVDIAVADQVIERFFDAIEHHPALPKVLRLRYLDGSGETYAAIRRVLNARGCRNLKLADRERPFASTAFGIKRTGSTRKKLRQDWNRLSAEGSVDVLNDRTPAVVREAFESYLTMEAESWKGREGTALLCNAHDAAFARRLIGDLAAQQQASVALLRINSRAIAAQVLLYCGTTAYTWKTAFDSEFARFSPGVLLVDKVADALLSGGGIEAIEACSPEGGFMSQLWDGRRTTVDLLVDVGPKDSLNFILAALGERGYAQLRGLRNRIRAAAWSHYPKHKGASASR
jgi:CelD/BcsL family acetyltransferase involved in cellulose biosynthesis